MCAGDCVADLRDFDDSAANPEDDDTDPLRSVAGWCRSADDGSQARSDEQDAARAGPEPKPREQRSSQQEDDISDGGGPNDIHLVYMKVLEVARRGYEHFNRIPEGGATRAQVESLKPNIMEWASYGLTSGSQRVEARTEEVRKVKVRLDELVTSDAITEARSANSGRHCDLMTRATTMGAMAPRAPTAISSTVQSGWEMIEITIDSGACDTVLPSNMLSSIRTESTEASRNGDEYEVANGHCIVNEGQKRCMMMTPGSTTPKGVVFQVSDVHKPLMSVGAMTDAGYEILFRKEGGFMRDMDSGEQIPLQRRGNLYVLKAWVCAADASFTRQS